MVECGVSFPLLCVLSKTAIKKRVADLFCGACEPYVLENSVFDRNLYSIRRSEFVRAVINHLSIILCTSFGAVCFMIVVLVPLVHE